MGVEQIRPHSHEKAFLIEKRSLKKLNFGLKTPENVVFLENENDLRSVKATKSVLVCKRFHGVLTRFNVHGRPKRVYIKIFPLGKLSSVNRWKCL